MTREEAQSCIKTIELLRRLAYNIHGVMDVIDAGNCEKIIEALSREPSEDVSCSEIPNGSDDAISRQAAIDAVEKAKMAQTPDGEIFVAKYNAEMNIQLLSPVQPERKTGRWLFGFNNKYLEKFYYCSNCGCRKYTEDEPSDYFCSNCGADMRQKEGGA